MKQIQAANEKISATQKQKTAVIQKSTRVPGDYENTAGDNDAENLSQAVKQEVVVKACKVKPDENRNSQKKGSEIPLDS